MQLKLCYNKYDIIDIITEIFISLAADTTTGQGFKGCLFGAQFDNLYPIKRVFQDPTPSYITLVPAGLYLVALLLSFLPVFI